MHPRPPFPCEPVKILILKPSSLGDVVQALPVLRLLKRSLPQSEIFWWLEAGLVPLLEGDPDLAGIIPFERERWRSPRYWPEAWRSLRTIRRHAFDWVIDLQSLMRSGVVAWLANGKLTVGLDDPREGARGFYDIIVSRPSRHAHAVDWYLGVLSPLGIPIDWNFQWLPDRPAVAAAVQEKWRPATSPWLILQPGARWLNKRWPVEYFAEVVRMVGKARPELRFAILGSRADSELGEAIARVHPQRCLDLTGQISLPEMVEWIRLGELMLTNDTGPIHVAAALGKPVVAVFGPTNPRRTGPYRQIEQVLQLKLPCIPCLKDYCAYEKPLECLRALSPLAIFERVQQSLSRDDRSANPILPLAHSNALSS
jgi:heptosyltransferase-1